jgi:nucleoside phosphorylase
MSNGAIIVRQLGYEGIAMDDVLRALPEEVRTSAGVGAELDHRDLLKRAVETRDWVEAQQQTLAGFDKLVAPLLQAHPNYRIHFFGTSSVPLMMLLGTKVSTWRSVTAYNHHHTRKEWTWEDPAAPAPKVSLDLDSLPTRPSSAPGDVVVRVSVSYRVDPLLTRAQVLHPIAEIDLGVETPSLDVLVSPAGVEAVARRFREALDEIQKRLPNTSTVHVFAAVPPGVAFRMGAWISETIHARVQLHELERQGATNGYYPAFILQKAGQPKLVPNPGDQVDVLIVTAVKDEWDAVLAVDTGAKPEGSWKMRPGATGPEVFYRVFTTDAGFLRIGVVQAFGMGGEQALIAAVPLLERHPEIRCLAMCGVCAGRRGDVALGDVIIADKTWPYDAGKLQATVDEHGHRTERFQGDMDLYRIHPAEWKQRAERFQIDPMAPWIKERPRSYEDQGDWVLERLERGEDPRVHPDRRMKCPDWGAVLKQLWKAGRLGDGELKLTDAGRKHISRRSTLEIDGLRDPGPFKTVVGPIASGAPVMQDPTIFERLSDTQAMRKVVGLEMETSAILGLAYLRKVPYAIVMKGVMDHADVFKSDNMKPFAAKASAECLIAFIRQNLPPAIR